ncbi:Transposase [Bifidobacterium longum subsp. longum]|nr:Transposase [Bifidobacterium longum subsp. longum]
MVGSVQVHNRRESIALDMKAYSHLSAQERIRIDELRNREGLGVCQIALRIGRDKSTVSREPGRGPWFASDENESYRPYRPKRLKTGAWTARPFYSAMTAQRKAETHAPAAQAHAHGVRPAARMGHGRAQEGVDAGKDRGAAEGRMARRPAYEDQPRMPPPVDPRETAEGVGPQAVPASRQAAPLFCFNFS